MLTGLPKLKELHSIAKSLKHEDVLDIVLIGSVLRGKVEPKDIDILLLFKTKTSTDVAHELRKKVERHFAQVEVIQATYEQLFSPAFKARSAFFFGYSLLREKFVSEGMGYAAKMLFKYSLKGLSQSKRMTFQYALYGRDGEGGLAKLLSLEKLAPTVFLCPLEHSERFRLFFEQWKMEFEEYPVLLGKGQI